MKKYILLLSVILLLAVGCNKIQPQATPENQIPPATTQTPADNSSTVGIYYLNFDKQEGSVLHTSLRNTKSGFVKAINFSYMLGRPFQLDGGRFYYINQDAYLESVNLVSGEVVVFPWKEVTSFWIDEGYFVYFTQEYCGEGVKCNVMVGDLSTQKIVKTLVKDLPKLVNAGPGVVYITPAKSNDRALALISGYGDGPGGYNNFWSLSVSTGKLSLVKKTSYIDVGSVCDDSVPNSCDRASIEAKNQEHQMYFDDYSPHGGQCGGVNFAGTKEFYSPGDTWFVGCEGD